MAECESWKIDTNGENITIVGTVYDLDGIKPYEGMSVAIMNPSASIMRIYDRIQGRWIRYRHISELQV